MTDYQTDQETIELIKQWWHDYGKYLAIAVFVGLAMGLIWHAWRQHQVNQIAQASRLYEQLLIADARATSAVPATTAPTPDMAILPKAILAVPIAIRS